MSSARPQTMKRQARLHANGPSERLTQLLLAIRMY